MWWIILGGRTPGAEVVRFGVVDDLENQPECLVRRGFIHLKFYHPQVQHCGHDRDVYFLHEISTMHAEGMVTAVLSTPAISNQQASTTLDDSLVYLFKIRISYII